MEWIKQYWPTSKNIWDYSEYDSYVVDFRNIVPNNLSPIESSKKLIKEIQEKYPPPYYLMLSGGLDSQALLQSWVSTKSNFIPIHFTFNKHWNAHDTSNLEVYCSQFNIKPEIRNLDIFDFYKNELEYYSKEYVCNSPQITVYIKMAELIKDGTVIYSGNPLNLDAYSSRGFNHIDYTVLGLYRYSIKSGRPIIPFFFFHSPELAYSFKKTEQQTEILTKEQLIGGYQGKTVQYWISGFNVIPTCKMTGFEKYKQYFDQFPELVTLQDKLNNTKYGKSTRIYDAIFRYSLYKINKYSNKIKFIY